jgi:hypothetical protein
MHAGFSFSYSPISLLLRQPLSIKKSYAGAIQMRSCEVSESENWRSDHKIKVKTEKIAFLVEQDVFFVGLETLLVPVPWKVFKEL